jgi:hypothetical protein
MAWRFIAQSAAGALWKIEGREIPNSNRSNLKEGSNPKFQGPEIPLTLES